MPIKLDYPTEDIKPFHWSERNGKWVDATCPGCKERHPVRATAALRGKHCGFHKECRLQNRRLTGDEPVGPYGSIFHHDIPDPDNPDKRAVTCGWCKGTWYAYWQSNQGRKKYSWICPECWPRELAHEQLLPKGSKVLYHTRAQDNGQRVAFECRGCFNRTGELKYATQQSIDRYIKAWVGVLALTQWVEARDGTLWCQVWRYIKLMQFWDELCGDCVRERGSLSKNTEDKVSKKSGTVTLFSYAEGGMVPVVAELCKCLWWTTEVNAVNNWDIYVEVCPYHQRRPREIRARLEFLGLLGTGDGDAQKNGGMEKKREGRAQGEHQWDRGEFKSELDEILGELLAKSVSVRAASLREITERLQLRGLRLDASAVSRRIKDATGMGLDDYRLAFVNRKALAINSGS